MKAIWRNGVGLALVLALSVALAQDSWQTHRGNNARTGVTTNSAGSSVNLRLVWTYPFVDTLTAPVIVDNDSAGTTFTPAGAWEVPLNPASDAYKEDPNTSEPYRFAVCSPVPGRNPVAFTWFSSNLRPGYYRIFVYVPSADTPLTPPRDYARYAEYKVTDSTGVEQKIYINQQTGGWIPLGDTPFYYDGTNPIRVTLTNLIVSDSPDYVDPDDPNFPNVIFPIVVADAVRFVPDYGTTKASPVVIRNPLNPSNHLVYVANGNGTVTCLESTPSGTLRVRWTFRVPTDPQTVGGQIYDDRDPSIFTAGGFFSNTDLSDAYDTLYHAAEPTDDPGATVRAYWRIRVPTDGLYYVYAWFPSEANNAQQAQYLIEHEDGLLNLRIDQRNGGRWVRLNNVPVRFLQNQTYEISVTNFSPEDVRLGSRRVIADAIRVESAEGGQNGVYTTPAVGNVVVNGSRRWVVVFGAENGRVYCLDALGDGQNGTLPGQTRTYWAVKPNLSGPFSFASPLIIEDKNLVVIGNSAGRVFAINTNLSDPNDESDFLRWQFAIGTGAFYSTPAYDGSTVYIGSVEGGGLFGRLYALDPDTNDDSLRMRWAYPPLDQPAVEPITTTPAVANGRIYFTTGGVEGGRIYAINTSGTLVWQRPAASAPLNTLINFLYSSPLVVQVDYNRNGNPIEVLYVATQSGRVIALEAATGNLLYISENLGGAVFSSPVFTNVVDTDRTGAQFGSIPAVVVGVNNGQLLALYADNRLNSRNGKAFEGWDLYADTLFSSPAVLDNWLYLSDDAGVTYAFNVVGTITGGQLEDIGIIQTPEPERTDTTPTSDYSKLKVTVTDDKALFEQVRSGTLGPHQVPPKWRDAFDWGETFYVIVWNFKSNRAPQVQVVGPGITREERAGGTLLTLDARLVPDDNYPNVALYEFRVNPSGQNFWTPGKGFELQIRAGGTSWQSDLDFTTPEIDRPSTSNPANSTEPGDPGDPGSLIGDAGWRFGVANPLAISGVGVVGDNADPRLNLAQGNDGIPVSANFGNNSPIANGEHGKQVTGQFRVRDRRDPTRAGGRLNARLFVNDLRWQGGPSAVLNPLPWEILPSWLNSSPDYPDIPARRVKTQVQGGTDLQRASYTLSIDWTPVVVQVDIPRYQPPNSLGYLSDKNFVYVDTNNNGRFDGLQLGAIDVNATRSEAYRQIQIATIVRPDPRMVVEEQTIDFGSLPGGFGFSWNTLLPSDPNSAFRPDNPIFAPYWKTFTVRNEGNLNLYPVRMGKAFNSASGTVLFGSDVTGATMPAYTVVHSTLDERFWLPRPENAEFTTNPFYTPTGGRQPYPILQKPQVGDFAPTVLSLPTLPPRRDPNIPIPPDAQPKLPRIAIAIPPFQPMGVYVAQLAPYAGSDTTGIVGNADPIATPPVRLSVRVRETQLTGSTNRGVQPMIDTPPAQNAPKLSDLTPTAFRDPNTGRMHLYWSSNRNNPNRPGQFFLYHAPFEWNGQGTLLNGLRTTNGWVPVQSDRWSQPEGPFPNDPSGNLFATALNLGRTLTSEEAATIKHINPVAYMTNPNTAWLFWTGEVTLRNQPYSLLFYAPVSPATGAVIGNVQAVPLDPAVPRSRPAITGVPGEGHWLFYVAAPSGKKQVYAISSRGDNFTNWRREQLVPISQVMRSVESVSAQVYPVLPTDDARPFYVADLVLTGTVGNASEILLQRFMVDPNNGNLLAFNDNRAINLLRRQYGRNTADSLLDTLLPMVPEEVAQKDADQNVWRVRHLDWVRLGQEWNADPTRLDLDIKVNGVSVIVDPTNPTGMQTPVEDPETGIIQFRYMVPGPDNTRLDRGIISVDPRNGTIRFVNFAPGTRDIVSVTYRPRVYRLTAPTSAATGTYSQVFTVLQTVKNPRHNANDPARSPVRKGPENGVCAPGDRPPVDRLWVFFRRAGTPPNPQGNFFYKTLRPGIRLGATVATVRGGLPLQTGGFILAFGTNHATLRPTGNNPAGASIGFYEYDANRGIVFFTTEDLGKEVEVRFLTFVRDANGQVTGVEERTVVERVRWIDEGNLPGESPEYTSAVPIDLPTNELYLWALPNLEFRKQGDPTLDEAYGGLDEMLLLFWSSTRNGVPELYGGALHPRFTISIFDRGD